MQTTKGLYRFKKGFGAEYTEFVGEIYMKFKSLRFRLILKILSFLILYGGNLFLMI